MDDHLKQIVDWVCEGRSPEITELHYQIIGAVASDGGLDEGNSILHKLRDIIDNYLHSCKESAKK